MSLSFLLRSSLTCAALFTLATAIVPALADPPPPADLPGIEAATQPVTTRLDPRLGQRTYFGTPEFERPTFRETAHPAPDTSHRCPRCGHCWNSDGGVVGEIELTPDVVTEGPRGIEPMDAETEHCARLIVELMDNLGHSPLDDTVFEDPSPADLGWSTEDQSAGHGEMRATLLHYLRHLDAQRRENSRCRQACCEDNENPGACCSHGACCPATRRAACEDSAECEEHSCADQGCCDCCRRDHVAGEACRHDAGGHCPCCDAQAAGCCPGCRHAACDQEACGPACEGQEDDVLWHDGPHGMFVVQPFDPALQGNPPPFGPATFGPPMGPPAGMPDAVHVLRQTGFELDGEANRFEELGLYHRADQLRELANQMRQEARGAHEQQTREHRQGGPEAAPEEALRHEIDELHHELRAIRQALEASEEPGRR